MSTTAHTTGAGIGVRLANGALAGIVGVVFGMLMAMMGMLPMVGMLVGVENAAVGFGVHLVNSAIIGAIFGFLTGSFAGKIGLILGAGEPRSVLYIVKRGRVRMYRITDDGRTVTTAVLEAGAVFGEMDLLGLRMRDNWAEALEPTDLCLMSRIDVRGLLFTDARIALRIAESLSRRIDELEQRLTDLSCKTIDERLAGTLVSLSRRQPDEPIKLTHQQLASIVGASRERVTTALGHLVGQRVVTARRGKIIVRDFGALHRRADGVPPAMTATESAREPGGA